MGHRTAVRRVADWLWLTALIVLLSVLVWHSGKSSSVPAADVKPAASAAAAAMPPPTEAGRRDDVKKSDQRSVETITQVSKNGPPPPAVSTRPERSAPSEVLPSVPFVAAEPSSEKGATAAATTPDARRKTLTASDTQERVRLFVMDNAKTIGREVLLNLSDDQLTVLSADGHAPLAAIRYHNIVKATYAHARDPQWDSAFPAPGNKFDARGLFGRTRHWLVIQTKDEYAILQLNNDRGLQLLQAFEARTGLKVTGLV